MDKKIKYKDNINYEELYKQWPKRELGKSKDISMNKYGRLTPLYRTEDKNSKVH